MEKNISNFLQTTDGNKNSLRYLRISFLNLLEIEIKNFQYCETVKITKFVFYLLLAFLTFYVIFDITFRMIDTFFV